MRGERGVTETGWESDGFLALAAVHARFDANTAASLLQFVMGAVSPPALKNHQGILKGITEWEVRVDSLKAKHEETVAASIKIVILVGMLPKEYQDMCFQQATGNTGTKELQYIQMRDKVMSIVRVCESVSHLV